MSRNFDKNKRRPSVSGKRVASGRGTRPDERASRKDPEERKEELHSGEACEGEDSPSSVLSPEGWLIREEEPPAERSGASAGEPAASACIIPIQVVPRSERPAAQQSGALRGSQAPVEAAPEDEGEGGSEQDSSPSLTSSQALVAFAAASARAVPSSREGNEPSRKWFGGLIGGDGSADSQDAGSAPGDLSASAAKVDCDHADGSGILPPLRRRRASLSGLPRIEDEGQADCAAGRSGQDDQVAADGAASEGDRGQGEGAAVPGSEPVYGGSAAGDAAQAGSEASPVGEAPASAGPATAADEAGAHDAASDTEASDDRASGSGDRSVTEGSSAPGGESSAEGSENGDRTGSERAKRPSVPAGRSATARKKLAPAVDAKKVGIVFGAIAAIALLAAIVACFGFGCHLNKSIVLENPELEEVLVPVQDKNQPFYTLFAVEYSRTSRYYEGPELLALVRTDPVNNTATIISVPSNTEVSLTDSKYHPISEAQVIGGDAYLVASVSQLLNVDIAHFIRTDDTGLARIVDRLGGIETETVQVSQEAAEDAGQDAEAPAEGGQAAAAEAEGAEGTAEGEGSQEAGETAQQEASAGKQVLNGEAAAAFARSEGSETSVQERSQSQIAVVSALLEKAVGEYGFGFVGTVGSLKSDFKTDMSVAALRSSFGALAGKEGYTTYSEVLPGEIDEMSGEDGYFRDKKATRLMMAAVNESGDPSKRDEVGIDKASVFIEVQNGTEINGGANSLREKLREAGWNVSFIGNNPDTDTPKTLILYDMPESKEAAEAIASDLGFGAVTQAGDEYQFGTDVLVVLGLDGEEHVAQEKAQG